MVTPGIKRCPIEHRSGTTSDEADLTGGWQCPGEGGQCRGWRGVSTHIYEDERGASMKKRRREVLGGLSHRGLGLAAER
jgi:hypothetical protein